MDTKGVTKRVKRMSLQLVVENRKPMRLLTDERHLFAWVCGCNDGVGGRGYRPVRTGVWMSSDYLAILSQETISPTVFLFNWKIKKPTTVFSLFGAIVL